MGKNPTLVPVRMTVVEGAMRELPQPAPMPAECLPPE